MMHENSLLKRRKRVPLSPFAGLRESDSLRHFYRHVYLPVSGTICRERFSHPEKTNGRRNERAAFCVFSKASMTAEAAFALPLFFLCVICLISMIHVYGKALDRAALLRETAMSAALAAGSSTDETVIDLNVPVVFTPFYLPEGTASVVIPCRACVRAWNGRDEATTAKGKNAESHYVYVTDNRSVYHTSASCTHLDLTIHAASASAAKSMKNEYGERYHACEKCAAAGTGSVVYITPYGDCWHASADCSGLKRSIRLVNKDEVEGALCQCSRCAAKAA